MHSFDSIVFQIDYQTFLTLSDDDLKEVGVSTFGARRKMLLAISGETGAAKICHVTALFLTITTHDLLCRPQQEQEKALRRIQCEVWISGRWSQWTTSTYHGSRCRGSE